MLYALYTRWMHAAAILLTAALLVATHSPVQAAARTPLKQGDRIVLLGDSITAAGERKGGFITMMREAIDTYRSCFNHDQGTEPQAMLALPVMVSDTEEEALGYASEVKVFRIRLESGKTLTVFSMDAAEEFARQSPEKAAITVHEGNVIHGSPETVRQKLLDVQRSYQVNEVFVVTAIRDFQKRLHSYELLAEAMIKVAIP